MISIVYSLHANRFAKTSGDISDIKRDAPLKKMLILCKLAHLFKRYEYIYNTRQDKKVFSTRRQSDKYVIY